MDKEQIIEEIKKEFEIDEDLHGDLENLLRNPHKEENFKIEQSISGSYMVRSDSKKFGGQAVVYENADRNKCVDYIQERQPAKKPEYYVIENLHDFMKGKNENITYGTLGECLEKYSGYIQNRKLSSVAYKDQVTCTLGVTTGRNDMDVVHFINGTSYAGTAIIREQEHNINKHILNDIEAVIDILDIREAAKVRAKGIDYISIEQLPGKEIFAGHSPKTSAEKRELSENMNAVFKEGQLQKVIVNGVPLSKTGYNGAPEVTQKLFEAMLHNNENNAQNMSFKGCYFFEVAFRGKFEGFNFENCDFSSCKFENAEFIHTSFKNATIHADADNVKFSEVSFENAKIYDSRWENTTFQDVDFTASTWKHVSTVQDTVSFQSCDFLLVDMDSVYIKGSKIIGEMKNTGSIHVTMGGATQEEISNHRESIMGTLAQGKATNKEKLLENRGKKQQPEAQKRKASERKFSNQKQKPFKKAKSR